jgi:hypothetical protein
METEGPLPPSQKPANSPYPVSDKSSSRLHILFFFWRLSYYRTQVNFLFAKEMPNNVAHILNF